jgi:hypothetical protein
LRGRDEGNVKQVIRTKIGGRGIDGEDRENTKGRCQLLDGGKMSAAHVMDRRIFGESRAERTQVPNTTVVERRLSELVAEEACITGWFFMTPSVATKFQYINSL